MVKEKSRKKIKRGGARAGAGRPAGTTKKKISISVDEEALNKALQSWGGKTSSLFDKLLVDFVSE